MKSWVASVCFFVILFLFNVFLLLPRDLVEVDIVVDDSCRNKPHEDYAEECTRMNSHFHDQMHRVMAIRGYKKFTSAPLSILASSHNWILLLPWIVAQFQEFFEAVSLQPDLNIHYVIRE